MIKTAKKIRILEKLEKSAASAPTPSMDWENSTYKQRIAFRKQHGKSKAYKQGMNQWWKAHVARKKAKRSGSVAAPKPTNQRLAQALKRRASKPGMTPSHGMVRDEKVAPFRPQVPVAKPGATVSSGPKSKVTVGKPGASVLGQEGVRAAPTLISAKRNVKFRPLLSETPTEHVARRKREDSARRLSDAKALRDRMAFRLKNKDLKPSSRAFLQGNLDRANRNVALYTPSKGGAPAGEVSREKALATLKSTGIKANLAQNKAGRWVVKNQSPAKAIATR